ncbi:hypothetical protein [Streptomyces tendae]|uniref:hypothetical protein n=1 Tax=Streptomyces tendae TaxID=1932 RepID=UPI00367D4DEE
MTTTGTPTEPRYAWGRRGRHRRPRPRRVLLAAGGLALAAGALSVVRLLPESGGDPGAFGGERTAREGEEGAAEDDPGDRAPAPGTPQPSRSDRPAPPPPPEGGTPPTSDPEPEPDDPGLCVPVIGLCVDLLRG